jgi:ion channel-forming bestrophin family protein
MLLSNNLRLIRVLKVTWRVDLLIILSCLAAYLMEEYLLEGHLRIPAALPTILGTAIAFFIGFNNNQAYGRWWEARTIWGAIVNDSRSWARMLLYNCQPGELSDAQLSGIQHRMVYRHIGFLYVLKHALRGTAGKQYEKYLTPTEMSVMEKHTNKANAILNYQSLDLEYLYRQGCIDGFRFQELNQLLVKLTDSMGRSERIKNTVFPQMYIYFTRLFIWIFVVLNTIVMSEATGAWSILLGWIIGFVFHTTHISGMSLMNPFEPIPTAVPLDQITRNIEINLLQTLGEKAIPEPVQAVNGEYVL